VLACPTPSRKRRQPTQHLSRLLAGSPDTWPTSLALSLAPGGLPACRGVPVPRFQGQGRPPGQATGGQHP
jgi:hypothetical protein